MPRQTIYKRDNWDEKLEKIEGWAMDGLIDEEIADKMGIHPSTLYEYKKKYPELREALKKGKDLVDRRVEQTLLSEALDGQITAIIFWLKNRKPDVWRDSKNIQANITDDRRDMSKNERKERLQELRAKLDAK